MLEPPSPQLVAWLRQWQLCTSADIRRCRRRVKLLAEDLPAFDSVWIDALVQQRKLTSFQGQILDSDHPEQLQIGDNLLVAPLGRSEHSETYLSHPVGNRVQQVLKLVRHSDDRQVPDSAPLQRLLATSKRLPHPQLVAPQFAESNARGQVLISRYVPGMNLQELMIRRGRFPTVIVREIARQMLSALHEWHSQGLTHGEIQLRNVRLQDSGTVVLVDAGIRPALTPQLMVHTQMNPDRCDGIAPELIGTGATHSPQSDLFAAGTLFWQLLTGRPPFTMGEPLAKLSAYRSRRIDDVRELAPDTPDDLAKLIRRLTEPDPVLRPNSAREAWEQTITDKHSRPRLLRRFATSFQYDQDWDASTSKFRRQGAVTWTLLTMITLVGFAVMFTDYTSRTALLQSAWKLPRPIPSHTAPPQTVSTPTPLSVPTVQRERISEAVPEKSSLPLPTPDEQGRMTLRGGETYHGGRINVVGPLIIQGTSGATPPRIFVNDLSTALDLTATHVTLRQVDIVWERMTSDPTPPKALIRTRSQSVSLQHCRISRPTSPTTNAGASTSTSTDRFAAVPSLAWQGLDPLPEGNTLQMTDCVFLGTGPACFVDQRVSRIELHNVLKTDAGELVRLGADSARHLRAVDLRGVTCRHSGSLIRLTTDWVTNRPARSSPLNVTFKNCVLDLQPKLGALVELQGTAIPEQWHQCFEFVGEDSLVRPPLTIALWRHPQTRVVRPLPAQRLTVEGLLQGEFQYAGKSLGSPRDSEVPHWSSIPRANSQPPGFRQAQAHLGSDTLRAN